MRNDKFITYKNSSLSFEEFDKIVEKLKKKFNSFNNIKGYILIKEENPIDFYTLLFALWESNKKVVFPNRDFFNGDIFNFVEYIITKNNIIKNQDYIEIKELPKDADTILFSSGSTGKPKGIVHNKNTFINNAKNVLESLNHKEIVSITPLKPYLVSALSHLLVHKLSKSHIIFIDIDSLCNIKDISKKYPNLSYVGSPMHLVSMYPFILNKTPEIFFSSGDVFYPALIGDILNKFPNCQFFNVYGMAELGGRLFINKIDKETNKNNYKSIGKNIKDTQIMISNDEVTVKSDLLFFGYIKEDKFESRKDSYFKTGDKVILNSDTYQFFGRKNDEIKVAGNKVSMKYIEQKIASILPDSYTPIVVSQRHELLGNLLLLVLYTQKDNKLSRYDIISLLREEMESFEIPHKIYYTNNIPYTQTMKIDRKMITNEINNMELLK